MPPKKNTKPQQKTQKKVSDLSVNASNADDQFLTTNQGVKINDNQNSLKAGARGPSLLEDFILREKITHFDHERIPERVVHARGSAAHGVFKLYESQHKYTRASFLNDTSIETPVFVRFSTVAGSRGSTDLARDVRGFAVKFYTEEGNFDLVGNNMPVFFIQDAMKFPDLIHAVKPEPHHEMPQAASAHDTFWDFISLMPESMHMIMWVMSDRAIPRSYRMMEGFGVHTFRFVSAAGKSTFVKFHWKPLLGVHSVAWDEALNISGRDPDFHRRDLWEAIESGNYPEWELGVQLVAEKDEHKFDFDLLDPTKLIPEELVPVTRIGKLTLNRNPDNFFAETEQVAFHVGNVVPGIDFTNDPLMQGRLFSYTDTQLIRLGGPNFHEIPINRAIAPVHNNQRDGHMRQTINNGRVSYQPNSIGGGCPFQANAMEGGFVSYGERIDAQKVRDRSESFQDHFSQARLFYRSQSEPEQNHIIDALRFELGKVEIQEIRLRMLGLLSQVNEGLANSVADELGLEVPRKLQKPVNGGTPADRENKYEPVVKEPQVNKSAALSMAQSVQSIATRKVAFLVADGVDGTAVKAMQKALENKGAVAELVGVRLGMINDSEGTAYEVKKSFRTAASVLYDAVYVPGGERSVSAVSMEPDAIHFLNQAFKHCKAVAFAGAAKEILPNTDFHQKIESDPGVAIHNDAGKIPKLFIDAMMKHRVWDREKGRKVPA